jgi:hypothetical protein
MGQSAGSIEPTVSRPRGGKADFLCMNFREWRKLQKVSGKDGYMSSAFITAPFSLQGSIYDIAEVQEPLYTPISKNELKIHGFF